MAITPPINTPTPQPTSNYSSPFFQSLSSGIDPVTQRPTLNPIAVARTISAPKPVFIAPDTLPLHVWDRGFKYGYTMPQEQIRGDLQPALSKLTRGVFRSALSIPLKFGGFLGSIATLGYNLSSPGTLVYGFGNALTGKTSDVVPTLFSMVENDFTKTMMTLEEELKQAIPIYKQAQYRQGDLWDKMFTIDWWADDFLDGVAFLLSAGGIGGAVSLGAKGLGAALTRFGLPKVANAVGSRIALRTATTILNTIGEAGFEAHDTYKELLNIYLEQGLSFEEARLRASTQASRVFAINAIGLSIPNFIQSGLFHSGSKEILNNIKESIRKGIVTSEAIKEATPVLKESFKNIISEGFWEESFQEATQLFEEELARGFFDDLNYNTYGEIAHNMWLGLRGTLKGISPFHDVTPGSKEDRMRTAIALGGLLGGGHAMYSTLKERGRLTEFADEYEKRWNTITNDLLPLATQLYVDQVTVPMEIEEGEEGKKIAVTDEHGNVKLEPQKIRNLMARVGMNPALTNIIASLVLKGDTKGVDYLRELGYSAVAWALESANLDNEEIDAILDGHLGLSKEQIIENATQEDDLIKVKNTIKDYIDELKSIRDEVSTLDSSDKKGDENDLFESILTRSLFYLRVKSKAGEKVAQNQSIGFSDQFNDLKNNIPKLREHFNNQIKEFKDNLSRLRDIQIKIKEGNLSDEELKNLSKEETKLKFLLTESSIARGLKKAELAGLTQFYSTVMNVLYGKEAYSPLSMAEQIFNLAANDLMVNTELKEDVDENMDIDEFVNKIIYNASNVLLDPKVTKYLEENKEDITNGERAKEVSDAIDTMKQILQFLDDGYNNYVFDEDNVIDHPVAQSIIAANRELYDQIDAQLGDKSNLTKIQTLAQQLLAKHQNISDNYELLANIIDGILNRQNEIKKERDRLDPKKPNFYDKLAVEFMKEYTAKERKEVEAAKNSPDSYIGNVVPLIAKIEELIDITKNRDDLADKYKQQILDYLNDLLNGLKEAKKIAEENRGKRYAIQEEFRRNREDKLNSMFEPTSNFFVELSKILSNELLSKIGSLRSSDKKLSLEAIEAILDAIKKAHSKEVLALIEAYENDQIAYFVNELGIDKVHIERAMIYPKKNLLQVLTRALNITNVFLYDTYPMGDHMRKYLLTNDFDALVRETLADENIDDTTKENLRKVAELYHTAEVLNYVYINLQSNLSLKEVVAIEQGLYEEDVKRGGDRLIMPTLQQRMAYRELLYDLTRPKKADSKGYNLISTLQGIFGSGKTKIVAVRTIRTLISLKRLSADKILAIGHTKETTRQINEVLGTKQVIDDYTKITPELLKNYDLLVIDEGYAIVAKEWVEITKALKESNTRALAMGDPSQITKDDIPYLSSTLVKNTIVTPLTVPLRSSNNIITDVAVYNFQYNPNPVSNITTEVNKDIHEFDGDTNGVIGATEQELINLINKDTGREKLVVVSSEQEANRIRGLITNKKAVVYVFDKAQGLERDEVYILLDKMDGVFKDDLSFNTAMATMISRARNFVGIKNTSTLKVQYVVTEPTVADDTFLKVEAEAYKADILRAFDEYDRTFQVLDGTKITSKTPIENQIDPEKEKEIEEEPEEVKKDPEEESKKEVPKEPEPPSPTTPEEENKATTDEIELKYPQSENITNNFSDERISELKDTRVPIINLHIRSNNKKYAAVVAKDDNGDYRIIAVLDPSEFDMLFDPTDLDKPSILGSFNDKFSEEDIEKSTLKTVKLTDLQRLTLDFSPDTAIDINTAISRLAKVYPSLEGLDLKGLIESNQGRIRVFTHTEISELLEVSPTAYGNLKAGIPYLEVYPKRVAKSLYIRLEGPKIKKTNKNVQELKELVKLIDDLSNKLQEVPDRFWNSEVMESMFDGFQPLVKLTALGVDGEYDIRNTDEEIAEYIEQFVKSNIRKRKVKLRIPGATKKDKIQYLLDSGVPTLFKEVMKKLYYTQTRYMELNEEEWAEFKEKNKNELSGVDVRTVTIKGEEKKFYRPIGKDGNKLTELYLAKNKGKASLAWRGIAIANEYIDNQRTRVFRKMRIRGSDGSYKTKIIEVTRVLFNAKKSLTNFFIAFKQVLDEVERELKGKLPEDELKEFYELKDKAVKFRLTRWNDNAIKKVISELKNILDNNNITIDLLDTAGVTTGEALEAFLEDLYKTKVSLPVSWSQLQKITSEVNYTDERHSEIREPIKRRVNKEGRVELTVSGELQELDPEYVQNNFDTRFENIHPTKVVIRDDEGKVTEPIKVPETKRGKSRIKSRLNKNRKNYRSNGTIFDWTIRGNEISQDEAIRLIRQRIPDFDRNDLQFLRNIQENGKDNPHIFGQVFKGIIKLKKTEKGGVYDQVVLHEVMHYVEKYLLDDKTRNLAYKAVRKLHGEYIDVSEALAELYQANKYKAEKNIPYFIKNLLNKLAKFFNIVLFHDVYLANLFNNINNGLYRVKDNFRLDNDEQVSNMKLVESILGSHYSYKTLREVLQDIIVSLTTGKDGDRITFLQDLPEATALALREEIKFAKVDAQNELKSLRKQKKALLKQGKLINSPELRKVLNEIDIVKDNLKVYSNWGRVFMINTETGETYFKEIFNDLFSGVDALSDKDISGIGIKTEIEDADTFDVFKKQSHRLKTFTATILHKAKDQYISSKAVFNLLLELFTKISSFDNIPKEIDRISNEIIKSRTDETIINELQNRVTDIVFFNDKYRQEINLPNNVAIYARPISQHSSKVKYYLVIGNEGSDLRFKTHADISRMLGLTTVELNDANHLYSIANQYNLNESQVTFLIKEVEAFLLLTDLMSYMTSLKDTNVTYTRVDTRGSQYKVDRIIAKGARTAMSYREYIISNLYSKFTKNKREITNFIHKLDKILKSGGKDWNKEFLHTFTSFVGLDDVMADLDWRRYKNKPDAEFLVKSLSVIPMLNSIDDFTDWVSDNASRLNKISNVLASIHRQSDNFVVKSLSGKKVFKKTPSSYQFEVFKRLLDKRIPEDISELEGRYNPYLNNELRVLKVTERDGIEIGVGALGRSTDWLDADYRRFNQHTFVANFLSFLGKQTKAKKTYVQILSIESNKPRQVEVEIPLLNEDLAFRYIKQAIEQFNELPDPNDVNIKGYHKDFMVSFHNEKLPNDINKAIDVIHQKLIKEAIKLSNVALAQKITLPIPIRLTKGIGDVQQAQIDFVKTYVPSALQYVKDNFNDTFIGLNNRSVTWVDGKLEANNTIANVFPYAYLYVINDFINSYFLTQAVAGHANFYGTGGNHLKRLSGPKAPGQVDSLARVRGENRKLRILVLEDLPVTPEERYEDLSMAMFGKESKDLSESEKEQLDAVNIAFSPKATDSTDAGGWMSLKRYEELRVGLGTSYKLGYISKPVHFGRRDIGLNVSVPTYIKYASKTITKELAKKYDFYRTIHKFMEKHNLDEVTFKSAVKVGSPTTKYTIQDLFNDLNPTSILEVPSENTRFQLNPSAKPHGVALPTQLVYFLNPPANVKDNKTNEIADNVYSALSKLIKLGLDDLPDTRGKIQSKLSALTKSKQTSPDPLLDVLISEGINFNNIFLEEKSIIKLGSWLNKNTVKVSFQGGKMVLVPSAGYTSGTGRNRKLRYYVDENGRRVAEMIVGKGLMPSELEDKVKRGEDVYLFGFRIPSTEIHSGVLIKVVDVYDDEGSNIIVAPDLLIDLHGSDFDVDALFTISKEVFTNDSLLYSSGQIHTVLKAQDELDNLIQSMYKDNVPDDIRSRLEKIRTLLVSRFDTQPTGIDPGFLLRLSASKEFQKEMNEAYKEFLKVNILDNNPESIKLFERLFGVEYNHVYNSWQIKSHARFIIELFKRDLRREINLVDVDVKEKKKYAQKALEGLQRLNKALLPYGLQPTDKLGQLGEYVDSINEQDILTKLNQLSDLLKDDRVKGWARRIVRQDYNKVKRIYESYLRNIIVQGFMDAVGSEYNITRVFKPISKQVWEDAADDIKSYIKDDRGGSYVQSLHSEKFKALQAVADGATLVGLFANAMKSLAYMSRAGKQDMKLPKVVGDLNILIDIDGSERLLNQLSELDFDGKSMWENFDALINVALDNVKDLTLPKVGINRKNAKVAVGLLAIGFSPKYVVRLLNVPLLTNNIDEYFDYTALLSALDNEINENRAESDRYVPGGLTDNDLMNLYKTNETKGVEQELMNLIHVLRQALRIGDSISNFSRVVNLVNNIPVTIEGIENYIDVFETVFEKDSWKHLKDRLLNNAPIKLNTRESFAFEIPDILDSLPHFKAALEALVRFEDAILNNFTIRSTQITEIINSTVLSKLKFSNNAVENRNAIRKEVLSYLITHILGNQFNTYRYTTKYGKKKMTYFGVKAMLHETTEKILDLKRAYHNLHLKGKVSENIFLRDLLISTHGETNIKLPTEATTSKFEQYNYQMAFNQLAYMDWDGNIHDVKQNVGEDGLFNDIQKTIVDYLFLKYGVSATVTNLIYGIHPKLVSQMARTVDTLLRTLIKDKEALGNIYEHMVIDILRENVDKLPVNLSRMRSKPTFLDGGTPTKVSMFDALGKEIKDSIIYPDVVFDNPVENPKDRRKRGLQFIPEFIRIGKNNRATLFMRVNPTALDDKIYFVRVGGRTGAYESINSLVPYSRLAVFNPYIRTVQVKNAYLTESTEGTFTTKLDLSNHIEKGIPVRLTHYDDKSRLYSVIVELLTQTENEKTKDYTYEYKVMDTNAFKDYQERELYKEEFSMTTDDVTQTVSVYIEDGKVVSSEVSEVVGMDIKDATKVLNDLGFTKNCK